jgi:ABC-type branched-subunit amino acid transport system ATPase component/ABC-type branched-subunit amino acid transport system permease subunit
MVPVFASQERAFFLTLILTYAMVGVSLTVLTGWTGQVSLGHFAFLGVGAYTAAHAAARGFGLPAVLLLAGLASAAAAAIVGLPAVRFRGLFLAVSTLAFAFVANTWLFRQEWVAQGKSGSHAITDAHLPWLGAITTARGHYYVTLIVLLGVVAAVLAIRRSNVGRSFIAVRDNEPVAAAHGLTQTTVKLVALALSGFIAGLAGALWGVASANWSYQSFDATMSLVVLSLAIVGGVNRAHGPILGAFAVFAWPYLVPGANSLAVRLICSGLLLMVVLLFLPEGLVGLLDRLRFRLLERFAAGLPEPFTIDDAAPALVVQQLAIAFDGPNVLDGIDIDVRPGEIVGIIGGNGAGKSTFLGCVSGHLRPGGGTIHICGRDVSGLPPEYRPWLGASRSFQDAALYAGLTVLETVLVTLDRTDRSGLVASAVGAPWARVAERQKRLSAMVVLDRVGLADAAGILVSELSTGMRRLCDLACVIASEPRLVLLDEPAAGVAQREVEALGPLLKSLRDELGCAIVLVEHDIPLVLSTCDRVYCFAGGRVIAEGTPAEISTDPAVIASYLGTSEVAIDRSGTRTRRPVRSTR